MRPSPWGPESIYHEPESQSWLPMDATGLQLDSGSLWDQLVQLLCKNPEWLSTKVKFFLPNTDLGSRSEALDPMQYIILQLQHLWKQGLATWQSLIQCVCMELEVPLDLEVLLLSTWGHEEDTPNLLKADEEKQSDEQRSSSTKSSPQQKHCRRQQQELAQKYLQLLKTFAQQHCGSGFPDSGQAYIPPILKWSRTTTLLDTQKGTNMGHPKTEDGADVSFEDLFNCRTHKAPRMTMLLGKAGMGKTTLAHQLRQKWAEGQLDHFQALFLFEFRQLNLITHSLTLRQLLFDLYLSPESEPDAVFQYLLQNASEVLFIFDGLDEALETETSPCPNSALSLFSDLCRGNQLPGCCVVATSRPGKLPTCVPTEAARVHMWGFDGPRVVEYVSRFFSEQSLQEAALAELQADRQLWNMCSVPALCLAICLCLHHMLPGSPTGQGAALPPTMTQLYMQLMLTLSPHRTLQDTLLLRLGEVALRGLETQKVIFYIEDIAPPLMAFGATHHLLTSFRIRAGRGHWVTGYAFTHLSLQEFLAALHLVANPSVDNSTLIRRITLNSHWLLRTKAKPGLSDHLPIFLAGLASCACRPFLSHVARKDEAWVADRQTAIVQLLKKMAARRCTGPKLVELCYCVAETQVPELAQLTAQRLPDQLAFHNFPLTYMDLATLASILEYRTVPIHLEFEGCLLEPHCPEALTGCRQIENLSFKSRKYGDAFAEALSKSLPTLGNLRKLGLTGSKITSQGISHLVKALSHCPQLKEISLNDNQLKDQEVLDLMEGLPHLPSLQKLDLSCNSVSVATLLRLVQVAVTCPTVRTLEVRETDFTFHFSPSVEAATEPQRAPDLLESVSQKEETRSRSLTLRLQKCQLRVRHAEMLTALLQDGPPLEELDLSENQLEDEGCRLVAEAVPRLRITRKLDLSDNQLSVSGLSYVLRAVSTCWALMELHISLLYKITVLTFTHEPEVQEEACQSAIFLDKHMSSVPVELPLGSWRIRLTHCGFQAKHVEPLCMVLQESCCLRPLDHLDLSDNALGDEGAVLLAQLLPGLGPLQSLDLSKNSMSLYAVLALAGCMSSVQWIAHLDVSFSNQRFLLTSDTPGRLALAGRLLPDSPAGAGAQCIPRSFRLRECPLEPPSLSHLCETLRECPGPLEVHLSCKALTHESLKTLLHCLSRLPQLRLLQLSETKLTPRSPLLLADISSLCPQLQKMELRSLHHMTLHFKSGEEQDSVSCRFTGCGLSQEQVEPLCNKLGKFRDLWQLDLSENLLGDDGLRCLLKCLQQIPISGSLDLSHNNISQEGVLHLLEMLPYCPSIQKVSVNLGSKQSFCIQFSKQEKADKMLRLSECNFQPEHVHQLACCLSQAPQLVKLTLSQCFLDLQQLMVFLHLLRQPAGQCSLRVKEPWMSTASVSTLLEVCTQASGSITSISISETQQQLDVQLEFPRQEENPDAVASRFSHHDVEIHHSLLETCARLQQLSLSQVDLSDTSNTSNTSSLLLLCGLLPNLSKLKIFRLTSSCVSTKGLSHLASGLSHCHHLEELDLSNNQLNEADIQMLLAALEGKCRLQQLNLSHMPLDSPAVATLIQGLSHMTLLQSLRLSGNHVDDIGCRHLSEALRAATMLEELRLDYNQIRDAGAKHLATILPGLPQLKKINLSANGVGPAGGMLLATSLTLCRHLEELRLGHNALGDPTVLQLAQGLPQQLRVLHLPSSSLGTEGMLSLGQALDGCPRMEDISLAENSLARSIQHLCKGFPQLLRLDLASCKIDNEAAKHLIASFPLCPALEEILLSWNFLGDEATAELAQILPRMLRLQRIDLEWNKITDRGAWLLAEGLAQGSSIQVIRHISRDLDPSPRLCPLHVLPGPDFSSSAQARSPKTL
ncbi:protein NLRC5 isoform X3 [Ochotona curzoniae]|uniref:protein NLRC5 isoform X3 n=1 Tax=Ochotona curzoniae TaxID=130825 RepID=UPI001B34DBEB|nr:protein NLRC5 isoform X3 [Ochotona curzoniae]